MKRGTSIDDTLNQLNASISDLR